MPVAREIIQAHIPIVLGHFCSAVTLPASSLYADAGIAQITFSSATRIADQADAILRRMQGAIA